TMKAVTTIFVVGRNCRQRTGRGAVETASGVIHAVLVAVSALSGVWKNRFFRHRGPKLDDGRHSCSDDEDPTDIAAESGVSHHPPNSIGRVDCSRSRKNAMDEDTRVPVVSSVRLRQVKESLSRGRNGTTLTRVAVLA